MKKLLDITRRSVMLWVSLGLGTPVILERVAGHPARRENDPFNDSPKQFALAVTDRASVASRNCVTPPEKWETNGPLLWQSRLAKSGQRAGDRSSKYADAPVTESKPFLSCQIL